MYLSDQNDIRNRLLLARLPAMPQTLIKLIELCQDDETGMAELAALIDRDAAMMAKVLSVANSAAYHRGGPKVGLLQALSTLGADMIKMLVISESVLQTFNAFPHSGSTDLRHFWFHTLTAAVNARAIAKKMAYPLVEEAYLAGLLHDVGRLALLAAAPHDYSLSFKAGDDATLCETEQRDLQISHAEAGAWLIERWHLGPELADSVLYHHETLARVRSRHPLTRIVHLADRLANLDSAQPMEAGLGELCDIDDLSLGAIVQASGVLVKKAAQDLGIELPEVAPWPTQQDDLIVPSKVELSTQKLAEQVRDIALNSAVAQSLGRAKNDEHLLEKIRHNAHLLLNLEDCALFLAQGVHGTLINVSAGNPRPELTKIAIAGTGQGGLSQASTSRVVTFIQESESSPDSTEGQLLRSLNASCLVCLPLLSSGACVGLIVGSIEPWRIDGLRLRQSFLLAFGQQAARSLQTSQTHERQVSDLRQGHQADIQRVAHEVNSPLAIIQSYLSVLNEKMEKQGVPALELSILSEEIKRVGQLMDEFSGATLSLPTTTTQMTEVNPVIEDLIRLFKVSKFLPSRILMTSALPAPTPQVGVSSDTLKQILINLIRNAIEAMSAEGRIEISCSGRVSLAGRELMELRVKDSGPGIPTSLRSQLFSPIKSTKGAQHRGLGLSIVRRLTEQAGGMIRCDSSDEGTTFVVSLPAYQSLAPDPGSD